MENDRSKIKKFLSFLLSKFLYVIFIFYISFLISPKVLASDFKTEYQVDYNLSQSQNNLNSQVDFKIKITNLKSEVFVSKFAISFPNSFSINNLKASDDNGFITPKVTTDETKTKIELEFSNPNIGRDSTNIFFLSFNQANLFKNNGKVWEVVLPVIENTQNESYKVTVNLPETTNKKISIAKPKPDSISGNKITWNNPKTKTIYAVFGDSQTYQADLTYNLKNDQVYPVFTEVAFPPETANQKIFLKSISPSPESVRLDEDGNYLGKYFLKPLETKVIIYKSLIDIYAKSRDEAASTLRGMINQQKNYLLTAKQYWKLNSTDSIKNLNSSKEIYDFVSNKLSYNFNKINSQNKRLGADFVLSHPDQAVCLEFADLFIGIAREKGIYSREIEGYGFSIDPRLQPLSLSSDILHAWPEYYDLNKEIWIQIDPTWESTSGIDYFSSFDLNHIVFAIHGKNPDYPLPAGMYKIENSRDVSIKPSMEQPMEKVEVVIEDVNFPGTISDTEKYQGKFYIKNNGNSFLWQVPVEVKTKNISITANKFIIPVLAPLEKKLVVFEYFSQEKNKNVKGVLTVNVLKKQLFEQTINIIPAIYSLILKIIGIIFGLSVLFLIYRLFTKIKPHGH